MNKWLMVMLIALSSCGVQRLDRAYLEYDVKIEKDGQPLSEEVLGKRAPNMRVTITGDTAFANYFYGKTMLTSIIVGEQEGWLIMKWDKERYTAQMTASQIETFLAAEEMSWPLEVQKGKQNCGVYRCKIAIGPANDSSQVEVAFVPSIRLKNRQYQFAFPQLPGTPVSFILSKGELTYHYQLRSLEKEVKPLRILIPEQYKKLTFEEFMALDQR